MIIQNNYTMPNAVNGFWLADKLTATNTTGLFTINIKSNKDLSRYMAAFFNSSESISQTYIKYSTSFDAATQTFTISGAVFIYLGEEEGFEPSSANKIDYLIFVSETPFLTEEEYTSGSKTLVTENLRNSKL